MFVRSAMIGAILFLVMQTSVSAQFNVQDLYLDCRAPERSPKWALCIAYISGVGNMMQLVGSTQLAHPNEWYAPLGICGDPSNGAMMQAFINWAEKNPQEWSTPRIIGVPNALISTWPCQQKK